jgi:RNA polymerase sigma-70 factor (ECF subfamily)
MENAMTMNYTAAQESLAGQEDTRLIAHAQQGDLEAFNRLVLLYQDKIFSLTRRILCDQALAEDITQNTFLAAYRHISGFRNGSFRSWLYRIAVNNCYTEMRKLKNRPTVPLEFDEDSEERPLAQEDLPGSSPSPEREYERRELQQSIERALERLDADQRLVVSLVDIQGLDYQEAAQIMGVALGTVKSRLARARGKLRGWLVVN